MVVAWPSPDQLLPLLSLGLAWLALARWPRLRKPAAGALLGIGLAMVLSSVIPFVRIDDEARLVALGLKKVDGAPSVYLRARGAGVPLVYGLAVATFGVLVLTNTRRRARYG